MVETMAATAMGTVMAMGTATAMGTVTATATAMATVTVMGMGTVTAMGTVMAMGTATATAMGMGMAMGMGTVMGTTMMMMTMMTTNYGTKGGQPGRGSAGMSDTCRGRCRLSAVFQGVAGDSADRGHGQGCPANQALLTGSV